LRACLLILTVTRGRLVPHDLQLQAGIAAANGKECFVIARRGWGKTMCIAIPIMLSPDRVSITISPLKRLQMMQVGDLTSITASFTYSILSRYQTSSKKSAS
ncbi:hypothetical protein B0H17DRAFT_943650, partial [Mycena rosella]